MSFVCGVVCRVVLVFMFCSLAFSRVIVFLCALFVDGLVGIICWCSFFFFGSACLYFVVYLLLFVCLLWLFCCCVLLFLYVGVVVVVC